MRFAEASSLRLAAALAAAAWLSACGPEVALDGLAQGPRGVVASVASGEELVLSDGRRVRLAGIAAPPAGWPYAAEAKAALERLARGKAVELLEGGAREDPAGRLTGQVRAAAGRRWLEGALLEAGAARVRTTADNRAMARPMLEAEARARAAKRGLWSLPAYQVRLPREVNADEDGFQVVEGTVRNVSPVRERLYLEFARDWRGGFSAEVPAQAQGGFKAAGVDLSALQGRLVRVRGEVRPTRFGPRLVLDHPEQVELLEPVKR